MPRFDIPARDDLGDIPEELTQQIMDELSEFYVPIVDQDYSQPDPEMLKRFPNFYSLSAKQRAFTCHFLTRRENNMTLKECAVRAGYTQTSATQMANKVTNHPKFKEARDELQAARGEIMLPTKWDILHLVAERIEAPDISESARYKWVEMFIKLRGYYEPDEVIVTAKPEVPKLIFTPLTGAATERALPGGA